MKLGFQRHYNWRRLFLFLLQRNPIAQFCIYAVCGKNGTITSRLIASKTKVAALSSVSIPHLELMGAMLGLKLTQVIAKSLGIDMNRVTFWTDSCNVLWWILGHSCKYKSFVANHIGEIQGVTKPGQWRHVPTHENLADYVTHGLDITAMTSCQHWWEEPSFLQQPEFAWPKTKVDINSQIPELHQKKVSKNSFSFVACDVESLINSCPLTYQSPNLSDDMPLTPSHFLYGQVKGEMVQQNSESLYVMTVCCWRQELNGHYWKRWMREWLPMLNSRTKWTVEKKDRQVDNIVMLLEPHTLWAMATSQSDKISKRK